MAKCKSSFQCVFFLGMTCITLSIWSNMSLWAVGTWCEVTVGLFDIHRVQYLNGRKFSMKYMAIIHSSCVMKSGRESLYDGFWSHPWVISRNRNARSSNSSVTFNRVFTSIISMTSILTLAIWQSMNSCWRPGVSVINTATILCYIKVSLSTFKLSWNTYFLNYLGETWSHGRHFHNSSIALFSKSLTPPNVCAFILSRLLIPLMGFPRLGAAFYTETAHECIQCKLGDAHHTGHVVSERGQLDSGGVKGRL